MRVEGIKRLGTCEVAIEVGRKTRERRATPTSNLQPQPRGTTLQQDRRIMLRTINRGQGREAREMIYMGGRRRDGEAQKTNKSCTVDATWKTGEAWAET